MDVHRPTMLDVQTAKNAEEATDILKRMTDGIPLEEAEGLIEGLSRSVYQMNTIGNHETDLDLTTWEMTIKTFKEQMASSSTRT